MDLVNHLRELEERRAQALRVVAECDKKLVAIHSILGVDAQGALDSKVPLRLTGQEVKVVAAVTREMGFGEIVAAAAVPATSLSSTLARVVRKGALVKIRRGLYAPAPPADAQRREEHELTVA